MYTNERTSIQLKIKGRGPTTSPELIGFSFIRAISGDAIGLAGNMKVSEPNRETPKKARISETHNFGSSRQDSGGQKEAWRIWCLKAPL